jgi:hypothetical protein
MTSRKKGSVGSADKDDNSLPSVNELSSYTVQEMGVLEIATQGFSLKATAALLGQSEDQVALETHEDWYAASIDPTDICRRAIRVFKELTASEKSKMAAADSRKCLRKFWGKASKRYNDTQVDIH